MINFLQINIGEGRRAHDMMLATAIQVKADAIIVAEPNKALCEGLESTFLDHGRRAAIIVTNTRLQITKVGPANDLGFRWIIVGGFRIYTCYWPPVRNTAEYGLFVDFLDRLEASIRSASDPVIVAGDFNAKSPEWGDHRTDRNGRALSDFMASTGLTVCNDGSTPTFVRPHLNGTSTSHIDITFVSEAHSQAVRGWKVREEYSMSLHQYISFSVAHSTERPDPPPTTSRWAWRKFNPMKLKEFLESQTTVCTGPAEQAARSLSRFLAEACDSCMPKGTYNRGKTPKYWWTQEIADKRKECLAARRACQRSRRQGNQDTGEAQLAVYKEARRKLKAAIRESKKSSWNKLCKEVETDVWGLPYKIVTKKLVGRRPIPELTLPGRLEHIVNTLFPNEDTVYWPITEPQTAFPEITTTEIVDSCKKIPLGKAPGPDGIPDLVIKQVAMLCPQALREVYNACFREGVFPTEWKTANLVLLRKGNKPLELASSYRPICLLNTAGKLLERLIKRRLEAHLTLNGDLNERQFGFRKGRSTTDAIIKVMDTVNKAATGPLRKRQLCALVAIDVANAFNSARWNNIEEALVKRRVPDYLVNIIRSYLSQRELKFGERLRRRVTCGVPQGSVIGPLLWNIMYDDLLEIELRRVYSGTTSLVAFADDVAVIATGQDVHALEYEMNNALESVSEWMDEKGLKLSVQKTEAIMLTSKRGYAEPTFWLRGEGIQVKDQITYLGVKLCKTLGFRAHLMEVAAKAARTASALARILPNVGGSRQRSRKLMATVVESQLLYAAPVWSSSLVFDRNVETLERPQRCIALRVAAAYRTVSSDAALVVAGLIPAHLKAMERTEIHRLRKQGIVTDVAAIRSATYQRWQSEWDNSAKGRWTFKIIRDVKLWTTRRFGNTDFHLTQLLTGHGCFGQYLHRFHIIDDPKCVDCGAINDDVEHTFFRCDRWWRQRRELEVVLGGDLEPETIVQLMLQDKSKWEAVSNFVDKVQSKREEEERLRQREAEE